VRVRIYDEGPMEQKLIDRFGIRENQKLNDDSMKQKRATERLKEEDVVRALKLYLTKIGKVVTQCNTV
jgi:hypothetical protein